MHKVNIDGPVLPLYRWSSTIYISTVFLCDYWATGYL